jgi:hypothetical protein
MELEDFVVQTMDNKELKKKMRWAPRQLRQCSSCSGHSEHGAGRSMAAGLQTCFSCMKATVSSSQ